MTYMHSVPIELHITRNAHALVCILKSVCFRVISWGIEYFRISQTVFTHLTAAIVEKCLLVHVMSVGSVTTPILRCSTRK